MIHVCAFAPGRWRSYLFVLPAQLAPSGSGGTLVRSCVSEAGSPSALTHSRFCQGAITQLDTPNPVLYIHFPEVRACLHSGWPHRPGYGGQSGAVT